MELNKSRIVLTGAAGGIGSELARRLSGKGARLVLVGRRADVLAALQREIFEQGGNCHYVVADLATHDGRLEIVRQANELLGGIDILINNE